MLRSLLRCSLPAAVLIVAAAPLRADTLKVPAQFETIQEAIDAAGVDDVVQVSKGVYAENVVINKSDLTLKGKGATINGRYLGNCITVTGNNVVVESLTLVNGGGEPLPPKDGDPTGGISVVGTGIELSKLTVIACEAFGIQLIGTGAVESCKVDACLGDGIVVETDAPGDATPTVISKNTITRCNDGIVAEDGPFTIEKNTIEQNQGNGIELDIPTPEADGGASLVVSTVSKNKLNNNSNVGLEVQYEADIEAGVLVEKNTIEENGAGCVLFGFNIDLMSNTVQNNNGDGILLFASKCTVEKNKLKGNGRMGIFVGAGETPVDGSAAGLNVLHQNTVQDNGGDGVQVGSSNNEVHDSTIKDNKGDGIDIQVGADANSIEGNKISDNEHDGIDNSGLLTVIIDNNSKNNGGADLAGAGDGLGTVEAVESVDNVVGDDSDIDTFLTEGELELVTAP